jgi:hypothetical protein
MLRNIKGLWGLKVQASDGEIGKVHDLFFDVEEWTLRYLVVDTGTWLPGRKVLVSPVALGIPDGESRSFLVKLTKNEVEQSPEVDTDKPVSRQKEAAVLRHFEWPIYWAIIAESPQTPSSGPEGEGSEGDVHLRSTREVCGYRIQASDGEIGHVEDFILEDGSWAVRYMAIDTQNWLPGRKVLISPRWIEKVSWGAGKVFVDLTQEKIKESPEYDPNAPVNREFEVRLYDFYGRPKYWEHPASNP